MGVVHVAVEGADNGEYEIEGPLIPGQARGPDALGGSDPFQIQNGRVQRAAQRLPVNEIPGMAGSVRRKPFEGGGGDIIVIPPPGQWRDRMESPQNWIVIVFMFMCFAVLSLETSCAEYHYSDCNMET